MCMTEITFKMLKTFKVLKIVFRSIFKKHLKMTIFRVTSRLRTKEIMIS